MLLSINNNNFSNSSQACWIHIVLQVEACLLFCPEILLKQSPPNDSNATKFVVRCAFSGIFFRYHPFRCLCQITFFPMQSNFLLKVRSRFIKGICVWAHYQNQIKKDYVRSIHSSISTWTLFFSLVTEEKLEMKANTVFLEQNSSFQQSLFQYSLSWEL